MTWFDPLPCAVLVTDSAGLVQQLNAELLRLAGGTRSQWLGVSMDRLLPAPSRIFLQTHVWPMLLRDGRVAEVHLQILGAGGARLPMLVNAALSDDSGHGRVHWTLFPTGERHRFEAELVRQRNLAESAARAVDESKRFVTGITDAVPGLLAYWDKDLLCRFANPAYRAWFAQRPGELLGTHMRDLLGDASFEQSLPHIRNALAGQVQAFQRSVTRRDGSAGHLAVHYMPHRVQDAVLGFFVHASDVTPLREAQLALQAAQAEIEKDQQRLRNLIDSTGAGTWEWNVRTGQVVVNARWAQMLGWSLDELGTVSNQLRADLAHPDELPRTRQLLRDHFAGRSDSYVAELRLRHRDGHWIWVEDRGRVVSRGPDGRPEWMFGVQIDIGERMRRNEALRRSEALLERTGEVAAVGGWELELPDRQMSWSTQTPHILGLPADTPASLDATLGVVAPEARSMLGWAFDAAITEGRRWDVEVPLQPPGGPRRVLRSVGQAEWVDGRAQRLVGAFQDISDAVEQRRALQSANQRMALAADSGGIAIWEIDLLTQRLTSDAWMLRQYELPVTGEHSAQDLWSLRVHADDRAPLAQALEQALLRQRSFEAGFRIVRSDGVRHMRVAARISRDDHGRATALLGVSWDVTALQDLSAQLAQQAELMRVTLQSIGDGVITTDATGLVRWMNPVAERMTGWSVDEAQGQPLQLVFHIVHEQTREPAPDPVAACVAERRTVGLAEHTLLISRDGREYGIQDSAAPMLGQRQDLLGVVLVFHDVSEQRRLSSEMTYRATHDALTGLVNRTEFELRLSRALRSARDEGHHHALLCIDLDRFKAVNDACGHAEGDRLLRQLSRLMADAIRTRDTLARVGGDEFAIVLEHCSLEQAQRVAQKICDRVDRFRFVHQERSFHVGTSIGLAPVDRRWTGADHLLQAADAACYAAKQAGRNCVRLWSDIADGALAVAADSGWSHRLEQALDTSGFVLQAQRIEPLQVAAVGLQARVLPMLLNEDGSVTRPGAFQPAAERLHLAGRVDRWVLESLVARMRDARTLTDISGLAVRLSAASVGEAGFHAWLLALLDAAGPDVCRRLCVECDQSAVLSQAVDAAQLTEPLRKRGVQVALAGFDGGMASLLLLKHLRVDRLILDAALVADLAHEPLHQAALRSAVDIARVLGAATLAEGVDMPGLRQPLRDLGVDQVLGLRVHAPVPLDELLQRTPALPA